MTMMMIEFSLIKNQKKKKNECRLFQEKENIFYAEKKQRNKSFNTSKDCVNE